MLAAFHLNLTALSYVALLVGLFLVYNTVSVAVLSRRRRSARCAALGVTRGACGRCSSPKRRRLRRGLALPASLVGRMLADGDVALTSTTVSAIYIATASAPPALTRVTSRWRS